MKKMSANTPHPQNNNKLTPKHTQSTPKEDKQKQSSVCVKT